MASAGSLRRRAVSNHDAGKRSASKGARSVWSGGKAAKPYLSLPTTAHGKRRVYGVLLVGMLKLWCPIRFSSGKSIAGITYYIWDVLIPAAWDQTYLLKRCGKCNQDNLYMTYIFPRADQTHLQVKHIVGVGPFGEYVPMMWETIPDGNKEETWIDSKYIHGRNIWGLNKPAVFSKEEIRKLFQLFSARTGETNLP
jgi:hypothetical protein